MNFDVFIPATTVVTLTGTEAIPAVPAGGPTKQTSPNAILALGAQYQGGHALTLGGYIVASGGTNVIDPGGQYLWPATAQVALDSAGNLWNQQGTLIADAAGNLYWPGSSGGQQLANIGGQLYDSAGNLIADSASRYFGAHQWLDATSSPGTTGQVMTSQGPSAAPIWANVWQDLTTSPGSAFQILTSTGPGQPVWADPPGAQSFQVPLSGSGVSIGSSPTVLASTGVIGFAGDLWMFIAVVSVNNTVGDLGDLAVSIRDSSGTTYAAGLTTTVASTNYMISLTALMVLSGPLTIELVAECPSGSPFIAGGVGGPAVTTLTAVHLA